MVFSIDKIDGSIVTLAADRSEVKDMGGKMSVVFYNHNTNDKAKDKKGHIYTDFSDVIVGCYNLINIMGFRPVEGYTEEMLADECSEAYTAFTDVTEAYEDDDEDDFEEVDA